MSSATYYAWKAEFGGVEVSEARRLQALEDGSAKLKRLLAYAMLDNAGLKDSAPTVGDLAAMMYNLISIAKFNRADPLAWFIDVLDRIADLPQRRRHELLP